MGAVVAAAWDRLCTKRRPTDDEYYQYLGRNSIVPDRQVDLIERAVQVAE